MLLSADAILAADDLPFEMVEVPEWGGSVRVNAVSGEEIAAFRASIIDDSGEESKFVRDNIQAKLLVRCLADESGKKLFSLEQAIALGQKSGKVLDRLYEVAQRLNGLRAEDREQAAKN